jgi:hypothetical protein
MANRPVLGPNVIRGGETTVDIWDDFFRNSSGIFGVPESKVIPYQAYLSTGNLNAASHGDFFKDIYFTNPGTLGAMKYRPTGTFSPLAISDFGVTHPEGNTAEHEYLHGIDRYFGDYSTGFGGLDNIEKWFHDKQDNNFDWYDYAYHRVPATDLNADGYDDNDGEHVNYDGSKTIKTTNAERAVLNPQAYADDLATSITGYGGPSGEYELQMMQDSWEKRGPSQWSIDPITGEYIKDSQQYDALKAAFINNPRNDRLGDAKGPLADIVAQSLSDSKYQMGLTDYMYNWNPESARYGQLLSAYRAELPGSGHFREYDSDTDIHLSDEKDLVELDDYYTGAGRGRNKGRIVRNEPLDYMKSNAERFARLGAMYMKREPWDEFNYNPENEASFREAMNYLLDRENPESDPIILEEGFKPDKGLVLTPTTVWEPNPITGGF